MIQSLLRVLDAVLDDDVKDERLAAVPLQDLWKARSALEAGAEIVRPEDLLGAKETAALLRVDRTTVTRWRGDGYLPAPFAEPASGPVWLRPTLEEFADKHRARADAAGRRPVGTARS